MPSGSILDMQDLGDGRYQATMANGSTPVFTGDAGRQAYERLRKQQNEGATADVSSIAKKGAAALAGAIPGFGPLAGAAAERYLNKPETATDAPTPTPGATPAKERQAVASSAQVPAPEAAPAGSPAPQPGQPPPAAGPPPDGALPYAVEGVLPGTQKKVTGPGKMINGQMYVDLGPGTKGSPGGITALGQQIMQGREDAAALAAPHAQAAAAAQEEGKNLAIQQVEAQKAYLEEQRTQAMLQAQNERDEAMAAEQHVAGLQARADAAAEEFANSRMPEQSAADKFFAGLGTAMGAFGATLAKTPNFAGEFIKQLAQNRIQKWEAETNIKGAKANNLLARYKDALGDMKLAKVAVKETLLKQAAIEADQMGLSTKSEQIGNSWRAASEAAAAESIKANAEKQEAFLLSFYGNKMLNKPATAGTPGGLVLATQGAYGDRQDMQVKQADQRRKDEEARLKAAGAGPNGEKVPDAVKKSVAELDAALVGIDRAEQLDQKLGNPRNFLTGGGSFASTEANEIAAVGSAIGPGVARAIEGDAATKDSMDRAVGGLTAGTAEQRKQAREQYRQQLLAKKQAILNSQ